MLHASEKHSIGIKIHSGSECVWVCNNQVSFSLDFVARHNLKHGVLSVV